MSTRRALVVLTASALSCLPTGGTVAAQTRPIGDLITGLTAGDPAERARAACELREEGDAAVQAIPALVNLLADAAPVERTVCRQNWWRNSDLLTTPGAQAAATLVSIGSRAFEPLLRALEQPQWIARRHAAWALGALDDRRALKPLLKALADREPDVRAQAAWALGALDVSEATAPLTSALKDAEARVRRQAAWALGAIGDSRATPELIIALKDGDAGVRRHAAWALGVIAR